MIIIKVGSSDTGFVCGTSTLWDSFSVFNIVFIYTRRLLAGLGASRLHITSYLHVVLVFIHTFYQNNYCVEFVL